MNVMFSSMQLKDIMPAQEGIPKEFWLTRYTGHGKIGHTVRKNGYGYPARHWVGQGR